MALSGGDAFGTDALMAAPPVRCELSASTLRLPARPTTTLPPAATARDDDLSAPMGCMPGLL
jgi:hypothetical protein